MEFTAEILCLGNELLIGRTINKNAAEISLALTKIGFKVLQETTVRDNIEQASRVLQEIVNRKPNVIIITGGLGPTHDDIQLEVVSNALSLTLDLDEEAVDMMISRYNLKNRDLTPQMIKMGSLPSGGKALRNSQGSAPGVELNFDGILLYSLPGVPKEMNAILNEEVLPRVLKHFNPGVRLIEFGFDLRGTGESRIVSITDEIRTKYPTVGFKSHPKRDETGYWLSLHTYQIGNDENLVKEACESWYDALLDAFEVELTPIIPIFDDAFEPE